ncbi:hypothetical protein MOMA_00355 [Moraxella macacae 0408225]|uniref:Uncharacterized protein n=1 Tax=Moraxella macacae 0408225 TaxID=1230338 RepID=L2F6Z9_9GAMM|nr:hypothetical protein [Moraxella macacae]ELA08817.1 hypothetical protein MOMA_00355 [Moraxella macacae 0408225]
MDSASFTQNMQTFGEKMRDFLHDFSQQQLDFWLRSLAEFSRNGYDKLETSVEQEFFIPASQSQINQALDQFVTQNVDAVLDLHLDLHENWLRLYATVNIQGVFAKVAVNLRLVHAQLDARYQRFVFGQLSNTDVLSLYTDNYFKTKAIRLAVWFFHKVLKQDPLGMILGKINLVHQKEDILYLDLGRWLKNNNKIMGILKKVQVNHGFLAEEQLVLKANVNLSQMINFDAGKQLISEADNPNFIAQTQNESEQQN